jgi:hypothetical protein
MVVRDSAGIRVVENYQASWAAGRGWRLESAPSIEIGVEEGEAPYQLYRVLDAARLSDGTILVSNSGSGELRSFDPAGSFIRSIARHGAGPGEFDQFSAMRICVLPGDRIAVEDGANGRMNIYSTAGEFVNTVTIEARPDRRPPRVTDCFADGSWLAMVPAQAALQGNPGEVIQTTYEYDRYRDDGTFMATLTKQASRPRYINQIGSIIHYPFIPLTTTPSVAAAGDRVFIGAGQSAEIEARGIDGVLHALIRWPAAGRQRSMDLYERYKSEALAEIQDPEQRRRYARLYEQNLPLPDSTPAFQGMLGDTEGNLWVERYRLPWERVPLWEVFNADGRWLGTVELPGRFTAFQIGPDFVLGRHADELGVERVRLYRLQKEYDTEGLE